jgi:hypothetical protein
MAVQVTYEIQNAEQVARDLSSVGSSIVYGVEDVLDRAASATETAMKANAPKFTGALAESIDTIKKTKGERWIGPSAKGHAGLSRYSPQNYAYYVSEGGGPSGLPNIEDIALRLGISDVEAFAFAKYLRNTGKSVRVPSFFIDKTQNMVEDLFYGLGVQFISRVVA